VSTAALPALLRKWYTKVAFPCLTVLFAFLLFFQQNATQAYACDFAFICKLNVTPTWIPLNLEGRLSTENSGDGNVLRPGVGVNDLHILLFFSASHCLVTKYLFRLHFTLNLNSPGALQPPIKLQEFTVQKTV
jgi:hypothetical protein